MTQPSARQQGDFRRSFPGCSRPFGNRKACRLKGWLGNCPFTQKAFVFTFGHGTRLARNARKLFRGGRGETLEGNEDYQRKRIAPSKLQNGVAEGNRMNSPAFGVA